MKTQTTPSFDWQPIETVPDGERVFLFFAKGEKGNGEIHITWLYTNDSDDVKDWAFWTWGGPNAGIDYEIDEKPTLWAPIEARHWPESVR